MTEPLKLSFDGKINLPMLGAAFAIVVTVSMWAANVNSKLDDVAKLVVDSSHNADQIAEIKATIAVIDARTAESSARGRRVARALGVPAENPPEDP